MSAGANRTITLDGKTVAFEDGETIYEIARAAEGDPDAVLRRPPRGLRRLPAVRRRARGCAQPGRLLHDQATDGMVVRTRTEALERHRKTLMELVVSENPRGVRDRPAARLRVAGAGAPRRALRGRRDALRGRAVGALAHGRPQPDDPARLRPLHLLLPLRARVRRAGGRLRDQRREPRLRDAHHDRVRRLLENSACTFCGQCVQTCPTGALGDLRALKHADVPGAIEKTRSICPYCGVGCSVDILTKGDTLVGVQPAMDGPANEGALCVKGQFAWEWVQHGDRLKTPLVRKDGELVEASWDEALDRAAEGFREGARASTAATRSTPSPRGARRTSRPTRCRSSSARASARTTSTTVAVPDTPPRWPVWPPRWDAAR